MSIAEFLHNNTRLPLCVKARVRRAAAYRALGQLEPAVQVIYGGGNDDMRV